MTVLDYIKPKLSMYSEDEQAEISIIWQDHEYSKLHNFNHEYLDNMGMDIMLDGYWDETIKIWKEKNENNNL